MLEEMLHITEQDSDQVARFILKFDKRMLVSPFIVEANYTLHDSSFQFSVRFTGEENSDRNEKRSVTVRELLTLAYI